MTRRYVVHTVLTLAVWVGLGLGVAQAGEIAPVRAKVPVPATAPFWELDVASTIRVSLFQTQGSVEVDVTDSWLPKPGDSVRIVVKDAGVIQPTPGIALVPPPASFSFGGTTNPFITDADLTTSAYLGECTNSPGCDDSRDSMTPAIDFELVGNTLTAKDFGGMAVVNVTVSGTTVKVVIPKDSDFNGIPDNWQNTFCPATLPCPTGTEDIDPAPVTSTFVGDGHGAFDEYRGFKFRGRHRRMDPRQKDVVAFRTGPWCVMNNDPVTFQPLSRLGGGDVTYPTHGTAPSATLTPAAISGTAVTFTAGAAVFAETDIGREIVMPSSSPRAEIRGFISPTQVTVDITRPFPSTAAIASGSWHVTSLFDNVAGLFGAAQVHLLHTPDPLSGAPNTTTTDWIDKFVRYSVTDGIVLTATADDRQINKNAVLSGGRVVRGKRVIECVDDNTPALLITTTLGLAARDLSAGKGYVILYTKKRIVDHITSLIAAGGSRRLRLSTFVNGAWTTPTDLPDNGAANQANKDLLISFALKFYEGMEDGHIGVLTQTETIVQRTSYGYHLAPFSGDQLDQKITTKVDKSTSGFNTFYIPSIYGSTDKADYQAR